MKIEYQKEIMLIFLEESLLYVYCIRCIHDYEKISKMYSNPKYKIIDIELNDYTKIDRTIFRLYDYHEEIYK